MATTDDSITSSQFENAESNDLDDVAWADSCLTIDPEISEPNLDSLKETLLEFVSYQSEPLDTLKDKGSGSNVEIGSEPLDTSKDEGSGSDVEISSLIEEINTSMNFETKFHSIPLTETAENIDEDHYLEGKIDESASTSYLAKAFLPTYRGEEIEIQYSSDSDNDLGFPEFSMEASDEDVFKVWDLGIPAEEDLLLKQLKKALADSHLKKVVSNIDGSEADKGFEDDLIDDLVAGIADLSLQKSD